MKKTIYNTFIRVTSQEQCDRLKQVCIENGLPMWVGDDNFIYHNFLGNQFYASIDPNKKGYFLGFTVLFNSEHETEVTESEWMQLLAEEKNTPAILDLQQRIDKALEYLESFNEGDRNEYLINILRHGKRMD